MRPDASCEVKGDEIRRDRGREKETRAATVDQKGATIDEFTFSNDNDRTWSLESRIGMNGRP
jgi:hypothetical protein